jgi:hypothetical protein
MNIQTFKTIKMSLGNPKKNYHLDVAPVKNHKIYYKEGSGAHLPKVTNNVSIML